MLKSESGTQEQRLIRDCFGTKYGGQVMDLLEKHEKLKKIIKDCGRLAVAFSGGVDSTFLLYTAKEVLGDDAVAITAVSCLFPARESSEAKEFCREHGIKQLFPETDPLSIEGFDDNPPDRCYICKRGIFGKILDAASSLGIDHVAEGSNTDDTGDYRPGMRAVKEMGILSPLKEAGLSKGDIRILSREAGLPTWNKPSFACLASRFVYGEKITEERLKMVDRAEQFLLNAGFTQFRVRIHGNLARIELLPEELGRLLAPELRDEIYNSIKNIGFDYVTLDIKGYRTGSMNEVLTQKDFYKLCP